ncbi:hypothetical protein UFOVP402_30 [uncultured Caudovirales phage]|uniref:Uncharacterized protein n=1 Tax=uncultured Caudovirales phage TaxID=2100421 RepID=A0A6J5M4M3_9CAUD|nr:hypothetical protein UFOVP402_30 [uncultured Caudovirales phage]
MYIPTAKDPKAAGWNPPPLGPFLLALLAAFLLVLIGSSCSPQKRISKLLDKHPGIALVECEDRAIIETGRDTVIVQDTQLLSAYEAEFAYLNTILDSLLSAGCDTVTIEKIRQIKTQLPQRPCPEKIVTVTKESTAKLEVLRLQCATLEKDLRSQIVTARSQIAKCEKQLDDTIEHNYKLRKQRNTYLWLLLLLLGWTFRKPLLKLIRLLTIKI